MKYITAAELVNEVPEIVQALTTRDTPNDLTKVDAIIVQKIDAAEAEFEAYISQRYTIPVQASDNTVPNHVKQMIMTLTKYRLYSRRNSVPDTVRDEYDNVIRFLKDVQAGRAGIPLLLENGDVESTGSMEITVGTGAYSSFSKFNRL